MLRSALLISLMTILTILSINSKADTGNCGGVSITLPFNDVMSSPFFCQIAAAYFSGLTNGTGDGTTFSPTQTVTREQMAAFISRTMDQSLKRSSRKAVTKKWWTPQDANSLTLTSVGDLPERVEFDGTDLWVANYTSGTVMRVRPSDGKLLDTWTGAPGASGILCAMGKIFITGKIGRLYMIDPTQPAGAVTTLSTSLGFGANGIAFDGSRIWTANTDGASISIISLNPTSVTTLQGDFSNPVAILYDGSHIWVSDISAHRLVKLNSDGSIVQIMHNVFTPYDMEFDGTNIWVLGYNSNGIKVIRVKDAQGNPLPTAFTVMILEGNGIDHPIGMAFDGERILITNTTGDSVSLWKATDLTPLGSFSTGAGSHPYSACSDGLNFWITLLGSDSLARF
jgi:DNA-binding beta-propeller fold protein YncE